MLFLENSSWQDSDVDTATVLKRGWQDYSRCRSPFFSYRNLMI